MFHRELIKRDGADHLVLSVVPGNFERLLTGEPIDFAIDGLRVTLVYGRTPIIAAERMAEVKGA